ncbi:MAG: N-acetylglucosamine-6-phosphate deacetylase [Pseudomonadota bacterium]
MLALQCNKLFDGIRWHDGQAILIEDSLVRELVPAEAVPGEAELVSFDDGLLVPGLVDVQVNGGGGLMFNEAPAYETLATITAAHLKAGTTSCLPTVISDHRHVIESAIEAVVAYRGDGHPDVLGLHIEGPFFAQSRRGAHSAERVRAPGAADIEFLCEQSARLPLVLTLAPEVCQPGQIRQLSEAGIRVCAGHSDASYDEVIGALDEGLIGFTHLFNAMSPLTAREPGMVGTALTDSESWVGMIADGHHVHPASLALALRAKRIDRLMLVSDAMATAGTDSTAFELYGETVRLRGGRLINTEGKLAGSTITLLDAVRYLRSEVEAPLEDCLRMASTYPARFMGVPSSIGQLTPGCRADILHLSPSLELQACWQAGELTDR